MTQEELEKKAQESGIALYPCAKTNPVNMQALNYQEVYAKGYKQGYQDAQSEVKDTAIAFAEWLWHNEWIETAQPPSGEDLYDLFLASQNKQLEDTDTIISHTENSI